MSDEARRILERIAGAAASRIRSISRGTTVRKADEFGEADSIAIELVPLEALVRAAIAWQDARNALAWSSEPDRSRNKALAAAELEVVAALAQVQADMAKERT